MFKKEKRIQYMEKRKTVDTDRKIREKGQARNVVGVLYTSYTT
jgi:hypothetical protein